MPESASPNAGSSLIRIHKVITRALAVSLHNSLGDGPQPEWREGFRQYEQAFYTSLLTHHDGEDEISFPFMRSRLPEGPYEILSQQHRQMIPMLEKVYDWCNRGTTAWEAASLAGLQAAVSDLNDLWHNHIPIEESHFGTQQSARLLTPEENAWLEGQLAGHAAQHALPSEHVLPFVLYNLEGDDRAAMALSFPPVISQQLVPVVWKPAWEPMQPFFLD
jgi:hemerythrin-like domain-containing protein